MRSAADKVNPAALGHLCRCAKWVLDSQIVPFWMGMRDDQFGGFYGQKDYDLTLHRSADKGVILHSRILWFFSELAMLTHESAHIAAAEHAYSFLAANCFDRESGGVFWSVTYDGKPSDTTKHTYNQAFAVYALSSYYAMSGNEKALRRALQLFSVIETRCRNDGGYLESFDCGWKPSVNDKLSENGVIAGRTMNTLLHIYEGYANLYRYHPLPEIASAMTRILDCFLQKVYDPSKRRLDVFFDLEYHSLIDLQSYGHDIEASWLLDDGCTLLGASGMTQEIAAMDQMLASSVYERAFREGSLLNECENGRQDSDRIWWVQAEAVVGFLHQWEKTGDVRYLDASVDIWQYIQSHIVDSRPESEWLWGVHADGSPISNSILSEWKCPYHSGRMCFEILRRGHL